MEVSSVSPPTIPLSVNQPINIAVIISTASSRISSSVLSLPSFSHSVSRPSTISAASSTSLASLLLDSHSKISLLRVHPLSHHPSILVHAIATLSNSVPAHLQDNPLIVAGCSCLPSFWNDDSSELSLRITLHSQSSLPVCHGHGVL